jgi:hypothetical protein
MNESKFRQWFEYLGQLRGGRMEWPQLIRHIIDEEMNQLRSNGTPYTKEVFIDRDPKGDDHKDHPKQHLEKVLVQRFFWKVHQLSDGQLEVGGFPVWLINYEVPNQSNEKNRRADLLGLKLDGSLVVFECKVEKNATESPLLAILEGLDYLGHLRVPANMEKLISGFDLWRKKPRNEHVLSKIPTIFRNVSIKPEARHSVIVLAPPKYFAEHNNDAEKQSQDWLLSDRAWAETPLCVGLDFAIADFACTSCSLLELVSLSGALNPSVGNLS